MITIIDDNLRLIPGSYTRLYNTKQTGLNDDMLQDNSSPGLMQGHYYLSLLFPPPLLFLSLFNLRSGNENESLRALLDSLVVGVEVPVVPTNIDLDLSLKLESVL